jgi:hypothetical protein
MGILTQRAQRTQRGGREGKPNSRAEARHYEYRTKRREIPRFARNDDHGYGNPKERTKARAKATATAKTGGKRKAAGSTTLLT